MSGAKSCNDFKLNKHTKLCVKLMLSDFKVRRIMSQLKTEEIEI